MHCGIYSRISLAFALTLYCVQPTLNEQLRVCVCVCVPVCIVHMSLCVTMMRKVAEQ